MSSQKGFFSSAEVHLITADAKFSYQKMSQVLVITHWIPAKQQDDRNTVLKLIFPGLFDSSVPSSTTSSDHNTQPLQVMGSL